MSLPGTKTFLSEDILSKKELKSYKVVASGYLDPEIIKEIASPYVADKYRIEKVIFKAPIRLEALSDKGISFSNCFFEQGISSWDTINFKDDVYIDDCFFTGSLNFMSGITFEKSLILMNISASEIIFQDAHFGNAFVYCKDVTYIQFTKATFETFYIRPSLSNIMECLKLDCSNLEGSMSIHGANEAAIYDISIRGGSKLFELAIEDISIHRIGFLRFYCANGMKLFNVKPVLANIPSEFIIADCNLSKAEFYSVNLKDFQLVSIFDSYLLDCTFVGTKRPLYFHYFEYSFFGTQETMYQARHDHIGKILTEAVKGKVGKALPFYPDIYNDKTTLEKLKETFRQIKYSYSKQGDMQMEHQFHAREMRYQNRLLSYRSDPLQKIVLTFSDRLSDFGQSLKRPLLGLFYGHLLLFVLLIASHGLPLLLIPSISSYDINHTVYWFFKLINPLRVNDLPPNATIIIDLLMRIWSSYMIYNFIRASRRYIR